MLGILAVQVAVLTLHVVSELQRMLELVLVNYALDNCL